MNNKMKIEYKISNEKSVLEICKDKLNISSRLFTKLKNEHIYLNNNLLTTYTPLKEGDILTIDMGYPETQDNVVPNSDIHFDILYEDEWLLIVNKPAHMPVHPTMRHYEDTLSNGVKAYFESINLNKKVRLVNRLDKDTSGIVIVAKCEYIQEQLVKQMQNNIFEKEYIALVNGILPINNELKTINVPIKRKADSIIERIVSDDGDKAITKYKVIKNFNQENYSLVKIKLETGRTHQIRVHFSSLGYPILGDSLYGNASKLINRQALHAYKVSFLHPIEKKNIRIISKMPKDIKTLL